MIDYSLIYFLTFFVFWIFMIDVSIEKSEMIGYRYLQFLFMIPLVISIANNSYVNAFPFGYVFCFVIGILSLYLLITGYIKKR